MPDIDRAPDTFELACIGSILTVEAEQAGRLGAAAGVDLFHVPRNAHCWKLLRTYAIGGMPLSLDTAVATIEQAPGLLEHYDNHPHSVRSHLEGCIAVVEQREESWRGYVHGLKLSHARFELMRAMDEAMLDVSSAPTAVVATSKALGRVMATVSKLRIVTEERDEGIGAASQEFLDAYDLPDVCYPFQQQSLNSLGGVRPGEVVIFSASTGVGKSLWATDSMLTLPAEVPAWFYTLEMGRRQIIRRMLCMEYGYSMLDIVNRTVDRECLRRDAEALGERKFKIMDRGINAARIHADVAGAGEDGPKVIYVDHLHLMPEQGDELVGFNAMVNSFKPLAVENDIAVILLAQLRRPQGMSGERQPRPHKGMLKGSSAIEQIADYIIFLNEAKEQSLGYERDYYEMWADKQRDGEPLPAFEVAKEGLRFRER